MEAPNPTSNFREDVVVCLTKPDTMEIHCHGGKSAASRIIDDLKSRGAIARSSDQRTAQQYKDRWTADAWMELGQATTPATTVILLDQARGALSNAILEIQVLKGKGEKVSAIAAIQRLLQRKTAGMHLTKPWQLAIAGPPNAGKSSLMNAILGYNRAIVDTMAGTTRDALREHTTILGWPFVVVDTAGIRDAYDSIETEGIQRAFSAIERADIVLLLVEPTQGWTRWHEELQAKYSAKCIAIHTKSDLGLPLPLGLPELSAMRISVKTQSGMEFLFQAIIAKLLPEPIQCGDAVPFLAEHIELLEELLKTTSD